MTGADVLDFVVHFFAGYGIGTAAVQAATVVLRRRHYDRKATK